MPFTSDCPLLHSTQGSVASGQRPLGSSRPKPIGAEIAGCCPRPWREGGRPLRVTFFGVRGSCPCSGPQYVRYGGNTACVAVEVGDEPPIVLDLGTGLRPLGHTLEERYGLDRPVEVTAFLSHLHWDHIIGLPFCTPLLPRRRSHGRVRTAPGRWFPARHHRPRGQATVLPGAGERAARKDRVPRGRRRRARRRIGEGTGPPSSPRRDHPRVPHRSRRPALAFRERPSSSGQPRRSRFGRAGAV